MAILSEYKEDQKTTSAAAPPSGKPFSAVLDPKNPLEFIDTVFYFVAKESDLFKGDSVVSDVDGLVKRRKERVDDEERRRKEKAAEKNMAEQKAAKAREDAKRAPNTGNGLDMDNYSWCQNLQEVTITVPVPEGTKSRLISCEMKRTHLKVGLKGQPPIIDGELFRPIKVEDSIWNLEDQKCISILLCKQDKRDWWKYLVKGDPEINTQKVEPESSRLSELDLETRTTVEKMMFDQRQKQMGLPTSGDIEKQELLKQFMTQNPNMDFSRAPKMN